MSKINARGGALVELALTMTVLTAIVSVTLFAAYAHFTRAWLEYTAEQALYCLSEDREVRRCRLILERQVERVPFLHVSGVHLARRRENWRVNVRWRFGQRRFQLVKSLSAKRLVSPGGLRS